MYFVRGYNYPYLPLIALIWPYLPLFDPKIPLLSIFSITYLYLPLFTYIWLYKGLITLIWAYLPLIALIWPYLPLFDPKMPWFYHMCHSHPIYAFFYWDCTPVQNFRAIGPVFMEILHFEDLGDTSVISECSFGANLVIDISFVCSFRFFTSVKN